MALSSSGFLETLSQSLFHFNYSTLSGGAVSWRLRVTASDLFAGACLGSLLTDILKPVLITSLQFKVTRQQDFPTTQDSQSLLGSKVHLSVYT